MAIKEIKQIPDEILSKEARKVDLDFIKEDTNQTVKASWLEWLKNMIKDLTDTMEASRGIGLAAPQIGIPYKVIVFKNGNENSHLINPVIIAQSEQVKSYQEGCLSVKNEIKDIRRFKNVTVKGYVLVEDSLVEMTLKSKKKLLSFELQHEIDHLNGLTIMDRSK
jgi:peptide deformylase